MASATDEERQAHERCAALASELSMDVNELLRRLYAKVPPMTFFNAMAELEDELKA